jgi:hypothetical protein
MTSKYFLNIFFSVEEVMMLFERVCDHLNEGNFESRVVSAVINLNLALKAFGPQADLLYKEQVDKLQVRTLNSVTIFFTEIN